MVFRGNPSRSEAPIHAPRFFRNSAQYARARVFSIAERQASPFVGVLFFLHHSLTLVRNRLVLSNPPFGSSSHFPPTEPVSHQFLWRFSLRVVA